MFKTALLSFLSLSFSALAVGPNRTFSLQAEKSIRQYFASGELQVESIKTDSITRTPTSGAVVYLVEAQVRAQNPVNMQMADYHCGVFIRVLGNSLMTQQTSCEILPSPMVRR